MEEKLNELLEKAELKLIQYERDRLNLIHKIKFLKEHGFDKELDWVRHQKKSMEDVYYNYKESIESIRDLLNKWNS